MSRWGPCSAEVLIRLVCWAIVKLGANITAYTVGTPGIPGMRPEDSTTTAQLLGIEHRVLEMSAGKSRTFRNCTASCRAVCVRLGTRHAPGISGCRSVGQGAAQVMAETIFFGIPRTAQSVACRKFLLRAAFRGSRLLVWNAIKIPTHRSAPPRCEFPRLCDGRFGNPCQQPQWISPSTKATGYLDTDSWLFHELERDSHINRCRTSSLA